ncbi:putative calpain-1 catalytic subunit [Podospora australis]|uniref:Calpain-1 catalytic subunit n=1 Tax=Podospora australis TaxID=1536484 RepID=A0AAN7AN58_9PEZI|nr:putative calpain-1 catalytic subunit [Podospora australis]
MIPKLPTYGPQKTVDDFWDRFVTKNPGKGEFSLFSFILWRGTKCYTKATTILPKNELATKLAKRTAAKDLAGGEVKTASASYEEAAALCRAKVQKIVAECRRVNVKYRDHHFDLDYDLSSGKRDCLESLSNLKGDYLPAMPPPPPPGMYTDSGSDSDNSRGPPPRHRRRRGQRGVPGDGKKGGKKSGRYEDGEDDEGGQPGVVGRGSRHMQADGDYGLWPGHEFSPRSVKRVGDIFEDPKFYIEGPSAHDVRQGRDGDCWLLAALCTLSNKPGLIERVCVDYDQDVGVYGFVFHRDGEWVSEIIDDKLYLIKPDYDEARDMDGQKNRERQLWDDMERGPDKEEMYRKAYQTNSSALYFSQCENPNETWLPLLEKAYAKAHGDYASIDGGFTGEGIEDLTGGVTSLLFTTDILDKEAFWNDELKQVNEQFLFGCSTGMWGRGYGRRKGIVERHAYSIMRAVEIDEQRLVMLKNPWGHSEWSGPWSDGSKEWTPEWMKKLNHKFGDDGAFWISYKDLLRKYQTFERTRLFGPEWKIRSMWTTLNVTWAPEYHTTKFTFKLEKSGPVVIVLSQLDDRYFRGLQGQYSFYIGFRLHKAGEEDYLVRSQTSFRMTRSCNTELDLEAGEYTVLVKIDADRDQATLPAEEVLRLNAKHRREKLLRIGLAYDLAHSKATAVETPEEKAAREAWEERQKEKHRKRIRKVHRERELLDIRQKMRNIRQQKRRIAHRDAWDKKQAEKREARRKAAEEEEEAQQREWERQQAGSRATAPGVDVNGEEVKALEAGSVHGEGKPAVENGEQPEAEKKLDTEENPVVKEQPEANGEDKADVKVKTDAPEAESAKGAGEAAPSIATTGPSASFHTATETTPESSEETPAETSKPEPATSDDTAQNAGPVATGLRTPNSNASQAGSDRDAEPQGLKEKLKKALDVVSNFKRELEDLLDGTAGDNQRPASEYLEEIEEQQHHHHPDEFHPHPEEHFHPGGGPPHPHHHGGPHPPHPHFQPHHIRGPPPPPPPGNWDRAPPRRLHRGGPPSHFGEETDLEDNYAFADPLSPDELSDEEVECLIRDNNARATRLMNNATMHWARQYGPPPPPGAGRDEFERDPWNAVAVVGLRIYYKHEPEEEEGKELVTIKVVRPTHYEDCSDDSEDEDEKKAGEKEKDEGEEEGKDETKVLDLDDSAKDAVKDLKSGDF